MGIFILHVHHKHFIARGGHGARNAKSSKAGEEAEQYRNRSGGFGDDRHHGKPLRETLFFESAYGALNTFAAKQAKHLLRAVINQDPGEENAQQQQAEVIELIALHILK